MLEDPLGIDRRLREVALMRGRFRRKLRQGTAEEHAFEAVGQRVSSELIDELKTAGENDPLGPALLRWAYVLFEAHALAPHDQSIAEAWHAEQHPLNQPLSGSFTLAELRAGALADRRGARKLRWDAFLARAAHAGDLELRRWERRVEHAAALHVSDLSSIDGSTVLPEGAPLSLLDATEEPFRGLGVKDTCELAALALGEDSRASWPARLSVRSLAEFFDGSVWLRHVTLDLDVLAPPLGAASFLRGLCALGRALRKTYVSPKLPFAVAHDPFELEASIWGALFAFLPLGGDFAARKLGVPRAALVDHRRSLSRVLLISAREAALRAMLRVPALEGAASARKAFPELGARAFGIELPAGAAGALFCPKPTSPQRFLAFLLAAELDQRLRETHDEDWYRNPRAAAELREGASAAPETKIVAERLTSGLATVTRLLSA